jgi:hypothetical protein
VAALSGTLNAVTPADGTFSASGATAWNALTGLGVTLSGIATAAQGGTNSAFFQVAGPTVARTYTFPDADATIARTDAANTFTGVQTFNTPIAASSVAAMTATVGGGVPTPPNNTTTFLRGDGTFAVPTASVTLNGISAATGAVTLANGTNSGQVWNWALTSNSVVAFTFGETTAATNGTSTSGVPNQVIAKFSTLSSSTASPLSVYGLGVHVFSVSATSRQIVGADGAFNAPLYSFAGALTMGMSRSSTTLRLTAGTAGLVQLLDTAGNSSGTFGTSQAAVAAGTSTAPGLTDITNGTTGLFWTSAVLGVGDTVAGEIIRFVGGTANVRYTTRAATLFANLPAAANGSELYCSDCDPPTLFNSTCASSGAKTGAFAQRINGAWIC